MATAAASAASSTASPAPFKWKAFRTDEDGWPTHSSATQIECENECALFFLPPKDFPVDLQKVLFNKHGQVRLLREQHVEYLSKALEWLHPNLACLDASQPWLAYWTLHALDLLDALPGGSMTKRVVDTLKHCEAPTGGYGGGYMQMAHTAATYASVLALLVVGGKAAYESIDRKRLYQFFMSIKDKESGGFLVHDGGEADIRAAYTVVAIADLVNILTPELAEGTAEFIASCQTYEGGFGGQPGGEAHGGYAFCGAAALHILGAWDKVDVEAFMAWLVQRQMKLEGGFQGRTNKLVDGCYSFWQGGTFGVLPIVNAALVARYSAATTTSAKGGASTSAATTTTATTTKSTASPATTTTATTVTFEPLNPMFDVERLQRYILLCCQYHLGGLRDKPSASRDLYHTCYCLSGLSVAQHDFDGAPRKVVGDKENEIEVIDCVYNLRKERVLSARGFFLPLAATHDELMTTT